MPTRTAAAPKLTERQVRYFRLRRSGLVEPFAGAEEACAALAGVQAQIVPAAGLSIWNRTRGFTHAALDAMLYERRTLVKLWGQRHTLHLYASREWPLFHGADAGRSTWWERRVTARGGDLEAHRAAVRRVADLLRERGSLGRADLRAAELGLEEELYSSWGGIFAELVRLGHAVHGKPLAGEGRFAHREHWLPALAWTPPAPDGANAEIARRYLRAYGPSTVQDFAYWRGAKVGDAKRWLDALADEVVAVKAAGRDAVALAVDLPALSEKPPPEAEWPVRMLYRFDPLLLAHKDKSWVVDDAHYARVWRPAGHIEGVVLSRGRAAATWRYDREGEGLAVTVRPFAKLPARVEDSVRALSEGVAGFFDVPLRSVKLRARR